MNGRAAALLVAALLVAALLIAGPGSLPGALTGIRAGRLAALRAPVSRAALLGAAGGPLREVLLYLVEHLAGAFCITLRQRLADLLNALPQLLAACLLLHRLADLPLEAALEIAALEELLGEALEIGLAQLGGAGALHRSALIDPALQVGPLRQLVGEAFEIEALRCRRAGLGRRIAAGLRCLPRLPALRCQDDHAVLVRLHHLRHGLRRLRRRLDGLNAAARKHEEQRPLGAAAGDSLLRHGGRGQRHRQVGTG